MNSIRSILVALGMTAVVGVVRCQEERPSPPSAEAKAALKEVADAVSALRGVRGDARQVLTGFADGSADAAFLDADKSSYEVYHQIAILLRGQCLGQVRRHR